MTDVKHAKVRIVPFRTKQPGEDQSLRRDFFEVSPLEAVEEIPTGEFELHPIQDAPPFALVDHAKLLLGYRERVGKPVNNPTLVERAAQALFVAKKRPHIIEGREVHWNYHSFWGALGEVLTADQFGRSNLFRDLQAVSNRRKTHAPGTLQPAHLSAEDCRRRGLWLEPHLARDDLPDDVELPYREVGADWLDFFNQTAGLQSAFREIGHSCLQEGRILAVDEFDTGGGLVAPSHWARENHEGRNLHYVFSRDLPEQWFNESRGPTTTADRAALAKAQT